MTGEGTLGPVSTAERCFVTCSGQVPYFGQAELAHRGASLPLWHRRPLKEQVGRRAVGKTEVSLDEIPQAIRYMGYLPEHFLRTGYVSRFPAGSFKAPVGTPIGEIPHWGPRGDTDPAISFENQPTRAMIGWGLEELDLGDAMSWGRGWGDTEGEREGKQWWDQNWYQDGANDEFAPVWHVLGPSNQRVDAERFVFDLGHPDVALYSFVDSQRRIVMANTLALAVPCGMIVNSSCEASCEVHGTGLNRLQCITRTRSTRCGQPVVDECNNDCGLKGQARCHESAEDFGSLRIGTTGQAASSSFVLGVGRPRNDSGVDNGLYMSHQDVTRAGVSQVRQKVTTSNTVHGCCRLYQTM